MAGFEKGFMLGAATAAHQVEGNNVNSDMWAMEHMKSSGFSEPSLDAVDHYHRYEEDIALMAEAGLNAYRFSIEWARIEPAEGVFDALEMAHYEDVIACCRRYGLEPIVTLHHFSSPKWIISKGGWETETLPDDFERYVRYVIQHIGRNVRYICTINEANTGIQIASVAKRIFKQMMAKMQEDAKDRDLIAEAAGEAEGQIQMGINFEQLMESMLAAGKPENLEVFGVEKLEYFNTMRTSKGDRLVMRAHEQARNAIKEMYPEIKVGLTLSLHDLQPQEGGREAAAREWEEDFRHYLPYIQEDDFLGVQNYCRSLIGPDGQLPNPEGAELTQMEYEFYPEALGNVLRKVAEDFHGELIVTENGIATADDSRRVEFIRRALAGVQQCIADGLPVKGYMYWSLLDNFEWQKGYAMTFGLIAVDRSTQTRYPKESLAYLGSFAGKRKGDAASDGCGAAAG